MFVKPQPKNGAENREATDAEVSEAMDGLDAGMTRRELFRRGGTIGAGAIGTAAVGSRLAPRYSPVGRARALAPLAAVGAAAAAAGVHYVTSKAADKYLGDDRDYAGYTGADALHNEIATGALEMQSADERVMTSIENNITHADNVALSKGKAAIIEEMNLGNPEEDAQAAMQEAIDEYFATIQDNLLTHYKAQAGQIQHHFEQVDVHEDLSISLFKADPEGEPIETVDQSTDAYDLGVTFLSKEGDSLEDRVTYHTNDLELLDGSIVEDVPTAENYGNHIVPTLEDHGHNNSDPHTHPDESVKLGVEDPEGSDIIYFDMYRYIDAWESILDQRDSVNGDLSGFVSDVYSHYGPGDIPTEDLIDPITAATELSQDYDNRVGQGAHAAMLGIPTTADFSAYLHIYSDDVPDDAEDDYWDLWADIFTNHNPTDSDGNEIGFEVGETYDPSSWDEPLYIAYEYYDEMLGEEVGDFTAIESEFTIELVEDRDGNEVTNFEPESRNNQTSDVEALEDELQQFREEWLQMQEEAQDDDDDDGDGWTFPPLFDGGGGGGLLLLVAGALAAVGLLNN